MKRKEKELFEKNKDLVKKFAEVMRLLKEEEEKDE